jgi:uncharacterized membrane protein YeaQ/YmgE (transglycosylase-associated protein family)
MTLGAILIVVLLGFVLTNFFFGSVFELIIALLVWAIIGALTGNVVRGRGFSVLGNILLGLIGGILGSIILGLIGLGWLVKIPFIGFILVGVIGGVLFVYIMRLIDGNFAR